MVRIACCSTASSQSRADGSFPPVRYVDEMQALRTATSPRDLKVNTRRRGCERYMFSVPDPRTWRVTEGDRLVQHVDGLWESLR